MANNMRNKIILLTTAGLLATSLFMSCSSIPKNAKPVTGFQPKRYLGDWHEIARFDYRFEKNLSNVMAQYSFLDNGDIKVVNSGFNTKNKKWKSSTGSAKFRKSSDIAVLTVTFFKPFYAGYNVIAIDADYRYALVAGRNLNYLWLLSREKTMPEKVKQQFLSTAKEIGYDVGQLIWVEHDMANPYATSNQKSK
jgi:apolipoprotein D and lipocalin family protein